VCMQLNTDDSRPPYVQVAEQIRTEIARGTLKAGDRVPSVRELSQRYGVASMTAQNALRVLRDEGLIYGVVGRGSFVRHQAVPPADEDDAPSPEFAAIMGQLEAVTDEVHRLADRVSELETQVQTASVKATKPRR